MNREIKFTGFMDSRVSGYFVINPYWEEYFLNLFFQGYYGEFWEEIMETKYDLEERIENLAYGRVEKEIRNSNQKMVTKI